MATIKNIVFDFGGILLELDQPATFRAFSELLDEEIAMENVLDKMGDFFLDFERGKITNETFIWKIQRLRGGNLEPLEIIKAYNAMLIDIRMELLPFLEVVKKKYRSLILSNTNAFHIQYVMHNLLEKRHGVRNWSDYFHHIYYSHEMGHRKPDAEVYRALIEAEKIDPRETLFIDDTMVNVTAAMECGWHAVYHDPRLRIEDKLQDYIDACETL